MHFFEISSVEKSENATGPPRTLIARKYGVLFYSKITSVLIQFQFEVSVFEWRFFPYCPIEKIDRHVRSRPEISKFIQISIVIRNGP